MAFQESTGIAMMADVLDKHMKERSEPALVLDFGEIQPDYSLVPNTFRKVIPAEGYSICRQLSLGSTGAPLCTVTSGGVAVVPEKMRGLRPGDHVLVAFVNKEPVVIDLILKASSL